MLFNVSLTKMVRRPYQPHLHLLKSYIKKSLIKNYNSVSIQVVIVSSKLSHELNLRYRDSNRPTNVISLEDQTTREQFGILQGEIILCDEIIVSEAKDIKAHYAHMIIHGMLHLQGFDHIEDEDALAMEDLEVRILKRFGFNNPYTL